MYFTPEEIAVLEKNKIYKYYADTQWSTFTVATVLAHLDAVPKTSVESMPVIKFLLMVLKAKENENVNSSLVTTAATIVDLNNQTRFLNPISALRADGMDTYSNNDFPTKRTTGTTITLSSGAVAATELVALVASKILWPEQIDIYLSPAAGLGIDGSALIEIEDSAATPITLGECAIGLGNPFVSLTNLKRATVAKAINLVATAGGTNLGGSKLVVRVHYKELS